MTSMAMLLIGIVLSLVGAVAAGVLPPRKVAGPPRIPPGRSAWPLTAVLFSAGFMYLFAQGVVVNLLSGNPLHAQTRPAPIDIANLTDMQAAMLATIPPVLALLVLIGGDFNVRSRIGQNLGTDLRFVPSGIAKGLLGIVIVWPPLMLLGDVVEKTYERVHFVHPSEHPFLHAMGQSSNPFATALVICGACIIAPVFEELLFRGYLQTLLRHVFVRLSTPRESWAVSPGGFAIALEPRPDLGPAPAIVPSDAPPAPPRSLPMPVWQTWAAILITSLLFALVHPGWSRPVIFALAVCLGYAYERTQNLWVPITIHAMFNAISTLLFQWIH